MTWIERLGLPLLFALLLQVCKLTPGQLIIVMVGFSLIFAYVDIRWEDKWKAEKK